MLCYYSIAIIISFVYPYLSKSFLDCLSSNNSSRRASTHSFHCCSSKKKNGCIHLRCADKSNDKMQHTFFFSFNSFIQFNFVHSLNNINHPFLIRYLIHQNHLQWNIVFYVTIRIFKGPIYFTRSSFFCAYRRQH